ncbi:hypothetical protein [Oceanimonas baumannii]|uniref:Uncharacterized protein n=1 Tax=Oceanimonas baumannii TaxID=129578 RepID=A0A235CMF4_9GAMM|nr:hypothetical protein [Oceanimonas baumannii]OYD25732.1 hypothetical protein B6S09_02505 [Oceanimonas baumannii]TDW60264.1 hypothetical protein LY04_01260 [Oceanimonas baumannii]
MNAPAHPLEQKLNSIKHQLFPLRQHVITSESPAVIEAYATLLAAILRGQPGISAEQDMLFRRLLHSMNLDGQQAQLLSKGGQLSSEELLECIELVKQSGRADAFLLDALIILRVSRPLAPQDLSMLSELTALFCINETKIKSATFWLHNILKLKTIKLDFKPRIKKHKRPSNHWSRKFNSWNIKKENKSFIERDEQIIESIHKENFANSKISGIFIKNQPDRVFVVSYPKNMLTWVDFIDFEIIIKEGQQ